MIEKCRKLWCRYFHEGVMRPHCGQYRCAVCLRSWPVPWEASTVKQQAALEAQPKTQFQPAVVSRGEAAATA